MLSGKRFRLAVSTTAVEVVNGKRVAVTLPAEAIIKVISDPRGNASMMDVLWEGRVVAMFAVDVEERGIEIVGKALGAS